MYRGREWTRRQIAGFGTAASTNERYKYLLAHGQTGLSTDFDHPTLTGYDSVHPLAEGEVGRLGVAIDTARDMSDLFDGIPIDRVSISLTINHPAIVLLSFLLTHAERVGVAWNELRGTVQNDSLKEFHGQKTFALPPRGAYRMTMDVVEFCTRHVPNWNTISISGYHTREAGSTAGQEVGFTLAQGMAYVEGGLRRGLSPDAFGPRLSFFFGVHMDFFEEIAKLRAARRLWARIMKERYRAGRSARDALPLPRPDARLHAHPGGRAQQPHPRDHPGHGCGARRHAVPPRQRLRRGPRHPLGGRHADVAQHPAHPRRRDRPHPHRRPARRAPSFVEKLSNDIEAEAWAYIETIEDMGGGDGLLDGMFAAIDDGYIEREISDAAFDYQRRIEDREYRVLGLNEREHEAAPPPELYAHRRRGGDAADRAARDRHPPAGRRPDGGGARGAPAGGAGARRTPCPTSSRPPARMRPRARSWARCARCSETTGTPGCSDRDDPPGPPRSSSRSSGSTATTAG